MDDKKGLKAHETSAGHLESTLKWTNYQEMLRTGSIISRVKSISLQDILDNRHFIKTVAQVIMLCAFQLRTSQYEDIEKVGLLMEKVKLSINNSIVDSAIEEIFWRSWVHIVFTTR